MKDPLKSVNFVDDDRREGLDSITPPTYFSIFWWLLSIILLSFTTFIAWRFMDKIHEINTFQQYFISTLFIMCIIFVIIVRFGVTKKKANDSYYSYMVPHHEEDKINPKCYYLLFIALTCYGIGLCLFQLYTYKYYTLLSSSNDIFNANNLLQFLRFCSIEFYALHRMVRPSNRIDPLRTIFDLDIVEICLDSIDLSVIYQIIFVSNLSTYPSYIIIFCKICIILWTISLVLRISSLYLIHLPISSFIWKALLIQTPSYYQYISAWFSDQGFRKDISSMSDDQIDTAYKKGKKCYMTRALIALRFRFLEHLLIILPEIFTIISRILILCVIGYRFEQIQLLWKNCTAIWRIYGVYKIYNTYFSHSSMLTQSNRSCVYKFISCHWCYNLPTLTSFKVHFYILVTSYLTIGILLDYYIYVSTNYIWVNFFCILDIILLALIIKLLYYGQYIANDLSANIRVFIVMILLQLNIASYRFPFVYFTYNNLNDNDNLWSLHGLTNLLIFIIIPYYAFHEIIKCMQLQHNLCWNPSHSMDSTVVVTSCDPIRTLVGQSAVTEGVLDVLSATAFFLMMTNDDDMNESMRKTCLAFSILELLNGALCFASSAVLFTNEALGSVDTAATFPLRIKVFSRFLRWFVDTGAFIVRIIAWLKFGVITSPFLIKNLYHMIHTLVLMERYNGTNKYHAVITFASSQPDFEEWNTMKISS